MDGFKNSTKTHYTKGGAAGPKGAAKVAKVMGEFKKGSLHSGKGGPEVTNPKQAVAIALSEARRHPLKKAGGGAVSSRPVGSKGRRISDEELSTPSGILAKSGRADPYERMPKTGPAPAKKRPLGRGAAYDIPLIKPRAYKQGGLAVMPKGPGCKK